MTDVPRRMAALRATASRGAIVVMAFTLVANAANYLTNLAFSRLLSPVGYGELSALLALAVVIAVPTGAAQTVLANRIATLRTHNDTNGIRDIMRYSLGHTAAITITVGLIYAASIPLVDAALDLKQPGPAIAMIPLLVLLFIQPAELGLLQGLGRFGAFGLTLFALAASRMLFGIAWVLVGGGAAAAIGGQAVGAALVLVVCAFLTRGFVQGPGSRTARRGFTRKPTTRTVTATLTFIAFAILSNVDIVLAKVFLTPRQAGIYAAIATVGKITLFLPSAVAFVVVPAVAAARASGGDPSRVLRRGGRMVVAIALIAVIPMLVAPQVFVRIMFGAAYASAASGVRPIVLAGMGFALLYLLCSFVAAIADSRWFVLLVAGVGLQIGAIALFHGSPTQIAWVQCGGVAVILTANEVWGHPLVRRMRELSSSPG